MEHEKGSQLIYGGLAGLLLIALLLAFLLLSLR
jgi:hypothetical protein